MSAKDKELSKSPVCKETMECCEDDSPWVHPNPNPDSATSQRHIVNYCLTETSHGNGPILTTHGPIRTLLFEHRIHSNFLIIIFWKGGERGLWWSEVFLACSLSSFWIWDPFSIAEAQHLARLIGQRFLGSACLCCPPLGSQRLATTPGSFHGF